MATSFTDKFRNAINLEQSVDMNSTTEYLNVYSSKKLALLGLAVVNLVIDNIRTGLGGKTVIELIVDPALGNEKEVEAGTIRVGDIVKLDRMGDNNETSADDLTGVIIKLNTKSISVSIEEDVNDEKVLNVYNNTGNDNSKMWIVKISNSITYKRMITTMNKLDELKDKPDLIKILLGEMPYSSWSNPAAKKLKFFNDNLNESQKSAIDFCLNKSPLTIIHGPPGTGKTFTIIEIIQQLTFNFNERVLVCGPSNISVDTILERLTPHFSGKKKKKVGLNSQLIRIGHPARLLDQNLQHSLDVLSKFTSNEILLDIENDITEALKLVKKSRSKFERKGLYQEIKQLKKELKIREKKVIKDILMGSKVVLGTLHGAGSRELMSVYGDQTFGMDNPFFDTIIIDEVSQSLEPQCWIPIINHLGCKRLIIAGDNMQLPPTIKSLDEDVKIDSATMANLEITLFDRLVNDLEGEKFKKLLDTQYRMNKLIMEFPSLELYNGELKAFKDNEDITLGDIKEVESDDDTNEVCIWMDTQGGEYPEQTNEDENNSKFNEMEIMLVEKHVEKLMHLGVNPQAIGIISPYNAQVSLIKKHITTPGIEISTVDGFQGREKEVIIMSLVRSNEIKEVGFLKDKRRLNVAMTRPKRQLYIIGDLELITEGSEFLNHWLKYVEDKYDIRYPNIDY